MLRSLETFARCARNVSFKLPSGTITGFVGENGAGKTTVIELILDIIKRDSGEILVFGMDNITHRSEIHEDIGVVFDTVKFPDTLTACDLNKIMSGIYKNWDEDEFVGYCARFALPIDKKFARFSRGMTRCRNTLWVCVSVLALRRLSFTDQSFLSLMSLQADLTLPHGMRYWTLFRNLSAMRSIRCCFHRISQATLSALPTG